LEYSIALMLFCLLLFAFHDRLLQSFDTCRNVSSDLEIYRVERATISLLREKFCFYIERVQLQNNDSGSTLIVCQETAAKRMNYYYCKNNLSGTYTATLYQSIKVEGKSAGINPLTPSNMEITEWHADKLSEKSFLLTIAIREHSSGREKKFFEVINLCNGTVL